MVSDMDLDLDFKINPDLVQIYLRSTYRYPNSIQIYFSPAQIQMIGFESCGSWIRSDPLSFILMSYLLNKILGKLIDMCTIIVFMMKMVRDAYLFVARRVKYIMVVKEFIIKLNPIKKEEKF